MHCVLLVSVVINALSSSTITQLSNNLPEKGITFIVPFFAEQLIHAYFFSLIMRTSHGVSKVILSILYYALPSTKIPQPHTIFKPHK